MQLLPSLKKTGGLPLVAFAVLFWAVAPFAMKAVSYELSGAQVTAIRFLLAGALVAAFIDRREFVNTVRNNPRLFLVGSLLGITITYITFMKALALLPVALSSFIAYSYPAFSVLLGIIFVKEKPTRRNLLAIACALFGIYLLTNPLEAMAGATLEGIFYALVTAIGWAGSVVAAKILSGNLKPIHIAAGYYLLGGLFSLPIALAEGPVAAVSMTTIALMGGLIVFSALAGAAYYTGLSMASISTVSVLEAGMPAITFTVGWAFFGETMTPIQLFGAGLILLGTVIVSLPQKGKGK